MKRVAGCFAVLASVVSCSTGESVSVTLLDRCGLQQAGASVEVAVLDGPCDTSGNACGLEGKLSVGDLSGSVARRVVAIGMPLPELGDLSPGVYAFAAIIRDESCRIMSFGCQCADLETVRQVTITPAAWTLCPTGECTSSAEEMCAPLQTGGCGPGQQCSVGECKTTQPDPDDGVPKECSLKLVAQGALPTVGASAEAAVQVTAPGIAATESGFVIACRTQDLAGALSAVTMPLPRATAAGTSLSGVRTSLGTCPMSQRSDGAGMAYSGGTGLLALSLPKCDAADVGVQLMPFDAAGTLLSSKALASPTFADFTLARRSSLAPRAVAGTWDFIYRMKDTAEQVQVQTSILDNALARTPLNAVFDNAEEGMIATGSKLRAMLAVLPAPQGAELRVGGADALLENAGQSLPVAAWYAIGAHEGKLAVFQAGAGTDPIGWRVLDATATEVAKGSAGAGPYAGGAALWLGADPVLALGKEQSLELHRASESQSSILERVTLTESLTEFDGARFAVAAGADQIGVVWLGKEQNQGGAAGGWAIIQCVGK